MHCKYHSFNVFYLFLLAAEVITWPENGKRRRTYKKASANIGHWEMDTVVSGKESKARLLVLSERASRKEIIIKMPDGTTQNVVLALDWLERRYGAEFKKVFQTITVDNGSEFADVEGMEGSYKTRRAVNHNLLLSPLYRLRTGNQ
ncbi:DDE-type integrase/transposase/recombinase [Oscillospiraceae bacterium 42-9]